MGSGEADAPGAAAPRMDGADETLAAEPAGPAPRRAAALAMDDTLAATRPPATPASAEGPPTGAPARELRRGETVGRYTVLRALGAGGMGVVYAAYDPELDRKVALKLIRGVDSEAARTRLYREAQALARLSHPNVVAIHDVGTHHGQVWLAMEFVVGRTLGAWREEVAPSWRQVVDVIKQVARGVAAAHQAGLLHRDLKPDNIMIGGDGRVRVMDFGLARSRSAPAPEPAPIETSSALAIELTATGALMGTPAYMAAEHFAGLPADARSDLFALCVTLWEALYGERPFAGETLVELAAAVNAGERRRAPTGAKVPTWVRRVAERGLERDPDRRFPSVEALLDALEADPRPRRWALGIAVSALTIAAAAAVALRVQHAQAVAACDDEASAMDQRWNPAAREALRAGLEATGTGYAPTAAERVLPWLDAYAAAWKRTRSELCLATTLERRWDDAPTLGERKDPAAPEATLAERAEACMEEGLGHFDLLIEELTTPSEGAEGAVAVQAVRAASQLPPPALCTDEERLRRTRTPPDRDEARRLRRLLARSTTLRSVGEYRGALALAEEAQARADALGWGPLRAASAYERGQIHDALGDYEAARLAAEDAFLLAEEAAAADVAADAAGLRAWVAGLRLARFDEGVLWGRLEAVLLDRAAVPEDDLRRGLHLNNMGSIYFTHGALDQAKIYYERSLELREAALGPEHPDVAGALNNLGTVYGAAGSYAEAEACFARTLEIRSKALGPEHPDVATSLNNLGNVHKDRGDLDAAERSFERALEIRERALGADHPSVASTLGNLGEVYAARRAYAGARASYERALAIQEATLGQEHPKVAGTLLSLGLLLAAEGSLSEAEAHLERARWIYERTQGVDHPNVATCLHQLATTSLGRGRLDEAAARHAAALRIREQALGPAHPDVAASLAGLGDVLRARGSYAAAAERYARAAALYEGAADPHPPELARALTGLGVARSALGDHEGARQALARALALRERPPADPVALAETRFALAQALSPDGERRSEARELAGLARDGYRRAGGHATELAEVEAWLATH